MSSQRKYGLRNAGDLLNRLRTKHNRQKYEDNHDTPNDKTFLQEDSIWFYQQHVKLSKKIEETPLTEQKREIQQLSLIEHVEKDYNSFCERLIIQKLQQTLTIYEEDLSQLNDNKCFLEDKIEFLIEKIRKLKEVQTSNSTLAEDNAKSQEYLSQLVQEYHGSMTMAFKSQLSSQQYYNSVRHKIRLLLKSVQQDRYYTSFAEEWNSHAQLLVANQQQIAQMLKQQSQKGKNQEDIKFKKINANSKKVAVQREQFMADEPKPKKKLSQSQKAALLGDLKSFAKSFKFPNS